VVLYIILAGSARFRPTPHQTTAVLGEMFLLWWIILAIDVKGLLVTRAFFFVPFLYISALIGLAAMLIQAIRPSTSLPGAIRLPEDNPPPDEATIVTKGRQKIVKAVKEWNPNLRRFTILSITLTTQLGFFIVLMVMENKWIKYQQPRDSM
jgi:hypothetical protein